MRDDPHNDKTAGDLGIAQALARDGKVRAAYEAFLQLGAVDEAARLLASLGHFAHACRLLLSHLDVGPRDVGALPEAQRRLALHAAIYAEKARQTGLAVDLFLALGESARAARALEKVGNVREASRIRTVAAAPEQTATFERMEQDLRIMRDHIKADRPAEAMQFARQRGLIETIAELFAEAGMPYFAAKCFQELGNVERALYYFVRVRRQDEQYRKAVMEAIHLARKLDVLDYQFEQFLTDFISSGPLDDRELETFYVLGGLYLDNDFPENAEEVYQKILTRDSSYRDVTARMAGLQRAFGEHRDALEKVFKEDVQFWQTDTGQDLRGTVPPPENASVSPAPAPSDGTLPFVVGPHGTVVLRTGVAGTGFEIGAVIAERYRVDELIGRGGMAMVFRAMDLELGEAVALKVFSQPVDDEAALARFRQELKLSRLLVHPNIIRLYDIGVSMGFRYITMELLVGKVLAQVMGRPIDLSEGLSYLIQTCSALQLAHENEIVHRDLKPSNLFITRDNQLKVMDFGIAKFQTAPGLTVMGTLAGTPEYMSPEQINDFSTVTAASDQYALGVIAYEMFTGRRPFEHPGLGVLLNMHLQQPPPPPRGYNPALPEQLEAAILKLLAKKPERRFSDCNELSAELERIRGQSASSAESSAS